MTVEGTSKLGANSAALLARCRAALAESDRTAQAADGTITISPGRVLGDSPRVTASRNFMRANGPARVLALNAAWRTVLDGAEQTIAEHGRVYIANLWACPRCDGLVAPPCDDYRRAVETLTVLAAALTEETT